MKPCSICHNEPILVFGDENDALKNWWEYNELPSNSGSYSFQYTAGYYYVFCIFCKWPQFSLRSNKFEAIKEWNAHSEYVKNKKPKL